MDYLQIFTIIRNMFGLKHIIDNVDINILNIEHYTVGKEWNYRNVNNPYSRIYYITSGSGLIEHHKQTFLLEPDHFYLIPCFTPVRMYCPDRFSHYYIHFTCRTPTGMDILSMLDCHYHIPTPSGLINEAIFKRLLELNPSRQLPEYDANKPIYQAVLENANHLDNAKSPANLIETNALMRLLLSAFFADYSDTEVQAALYGLSRFNTVIDYIHTRLDSQMTIRELAKIVHLNPTYFSNLFSKLMGISPIQYINKRRVEKAQSLLLTTDATLYTIAQKVGFLDEYYFSRIFKKITGIAPQHYRQQNILLHQRDNRV
ncbi:MAG: helix-turn-helix domain-containing protein [Sedimentisphaerales bacterium]|nr:helix-turn-helix domain-containing protein [Sedimentisphaerales bacterium]